VCYGLIRQGQQRYWNYTTQCLPDYAQYFRSTRKEYIISRLVFMEHVSNCTDNYVLGVYFLWAFYFCTNTISFLFMFFLLTNIFSLIITIKINTNHILSKFTGVRIIMSGSAIIVNLFKIWRFFNFYIIKIHKLFWSFH